MYHQSKSNHPEYFPVIPLVFPQCGQCHPLSEPFPSASNYIYLTVYLYIQTMSIFFWGGAGGGSDIEATFLAI